MQLTDSIDAEFGFVAFLVELLNALKCEEINELYKKNPLNAESFFKLPIRVKCGENHLRCYNISGLISIADLNPKGLALGLRYWLNSA